MSDQTIEQLKKIHNEISALISKKESEENAKEFIALENDPRIEEIEKLKEQLLECDSITIKVPTEVIIPSVDLYECGLEMTIDEDNYDSNKRTIESCLFDAVYEAEDNCDTQFHGEAIEKAIDDGKIAKKINKKVSYAMRILELIKELSSESNIESSKVLEYISK